MNYILGDWKVMPVEEILGHNTHIATVSKRCAEPYSYMGLVWQPPSVYTIRGSFGHTTFNELMPQATFVMMVTKKKGDNFREVNLTNE